MANAFFHATDSVIEVENQLRILPCEEMNKQASPNTGTSCPICQNEWNAFHSSSNATVLDCGHAVCLGDLFRAGLGTEVDIEL
jgi:hypothetical protein